MERRAIEPALMNLLKNLTMREPKDGHEHGQ